MSNKAFFFKLLLGLLFITQCFCNQLTNLDKLSGEDAVTVLETISKLKTDPTDQQLYERFTNITRLDYKTQNVTLVEERLRNVIKQTFENTSFFVKMANLMTFKNVITVLLVIVAIAFLFALFHSIIIFLAMNFLMLAVLLIDKKTIYTLGYMLSCVTMYYKYDEVTNPYMKLLFIFDSLTPLFGSLLFTAITHAMFADFCKFSNDRKNNKHIMAFATLLSTGTLGITTVYHNNYIIGIFTVIGLFASFGFMIGSFYGGYYTEFDDDYNMVRCLMISIMLNGAYIAKLLGVFDYGCFAVFETGIVFWGSIVGSIALLILVDEIYMRYKKMYDVGLYMFAQIVMVAYCIAMIYFGNMFNVTSYKSIGGTFLVLWALDFERTLLSKMAKGSLTMTLFMIMSNLYLLKQYIQTYPEYFIL